MGYGKYPWDKIPMGYPWEFFYQVISLWERGELRRKRLRKEISLEPRMERTMRQVFCECTAMSRDMQVRVVICDWLAWLLRMKRPKKDVSVEAVLDTPQSHHNDDLVTRTEDASSTQVTHGLDLTSC